MVPLSHRGKAIPGRELSLLRGSSWVIAKGAKTARRTAVFAEVLRKPHAVDVGCAFHDSESEDSGDYWSAASAAPAEKLLSSKRPKARFLKANSAEIESSQGFPLTHTGNSCDTGMIFRDAYAASTSTRGGSTVLGRRDKWLRLSHCARLNVLPYANIPVLAPRPRHWHSHLRLEILLPTHVLR